MKPVTVILSALILLVGITSMSRPGGAPSMLPLSSVDYTYKPALHRVLWERCDLYYTNGWYCGEIAPDTNLAIVGDHFFRSTETRVHKLCLAGQKIRVVGAHTIFISSNNQLGKTRITNYDSSVTIYRDNNSFTLKCNETAIIKQNRKVEIFHNDFSKADSLWLTTGEIILNNVDMPSLIERLAKNYDCNVVFNYVPDEDKLMNDHNTYFDCKSGNLLDGLLLLQTIATDGQKFSFDVKNRNVIINKPTL